MNVIIKRTFGVIIAAMIMSATVPLMAKQANGPAGSGPGGTSIDLNKPSDGNTVDYSLLKVASVDVAFANYYTMGKYRDFSDMNFGPSIQVNMQIAGIKMLRVYGAFSSSYNMTNSDRLDVINDFTGHFGAGLHLRLSKYFSLTPQAGYGMMLHMGYGDYHLTGEKKYHIFTDQVFNFEVEAALHFTVGANNFPLKVFVSPAYMVFIEEIHAGQELGYRFGVGFEF